MRPCDRGQWAPVAGAAGLVLACYVAGWRGTDWAAQVYRSSQDAHYGLVIWDPGWYGGTFPLNYSLLLPLLGAQIGLWPVAVVSAASSTYCFDRLLRPISRQGRHPSLVSLYFGAATVIEVAIGQLPTLVGEAFALACLLCFVRSGSALSSERAFLEGVGTRAAAWLVSGTAFGLAAALTAPLAGAFLALALCAWGAADLAKLRQGAANLGHGPQGSALVKVALAKLVGAALALAGSAALPTIFPVPGHYPFLGGDLGVVLAICAFCAGPWVPPALRSGAVLYGAVSVVLFVVPNQVGENDARLAAYIGVPLVLYYMPSAIRWAGSALPVRGRLSAEGVVAAVAVGAALATVLWEWAPIGGTSSGAADGRSSTPEFYRPLVRELAALGQGRPLRVEVPPTVNHWESAYVAANFPLARGWERQVDLAYNGIFYQASPPSPEVYRSWLLANGVSYVALASAPLDYSAQGEAKLLRSGTVPGLDLVWESRDWFLWAVTGSAGLATAPAAVTLFQPGRVTVTFPREGKSVLKVRWSSKLSVSPSSRSWVCLRRSQAGWAQLSSTRPGKVTLTVSVLAPDHGNCVGGTAPPVPTVATPPKRTIPGDGL